MVSPIDYSLDVQAPMQSALQGFQTGIGIADLQAKRQQQEAAAAQQRMQAQVITDLMSKPNATAEDYARATIAVPGLREQFKQSWEMHNADQQQNSLTEMGQVYAALSNGKPDIAASILSKRAQALKNAGGDARQIKAAEDMAQTIEAAPDFARAMVGMRLASIPGADKLFENLGKKGTEERAAEQAPSDLAKKREDAKKAKSDAEIAAVKAQFAGSDAVADLERKGWDLKKIAADIDIAKQNSRIAAMNAQTSRMNSDLQRQELALKIEEATAKRDSTIREKVASAESGARSIDNMLNTIERVKKNPALNAVLGSIEGGRFYPQRIAGMLPGTASADDRADVISLIDTLGSQAFLSQLPAMKSLGALSEKEGDKLQSSLQNFSREQSEKQFRENLDEAARLLIKGREGLARATGVPLGKPDTPAAPGARPPLSAFNK